MNVHKRYFQTLPGHIVQSIILYTVDFEKGNIGFYKNVGLSFIHSCHRWRTIYFEFAFTTINLCVSSAEFCYEFDDYARWYRNPMELPLERLVKTMTLHLDLTYFYVQHNVLDAFLDMDFAQYTFEKAKNMDVCVIIDDYKYLDNYQDFGKDAHAYAISQLDKMLVHLRKMVPHLQDIYFGWLNEVFLLDGHGFSKDIESCIINAIKGLSSIGIEDFSCSLDPVNLKANNFLSLTSLVINFSLQKKWGVEVIRLSSQALRVLDINEIYGSSFKSLLFNDEGKPIIYDCLEKLDFFCKTAYNLGDIRNDKVIHFPVLKKLKLAGKPLSSKALFCDSSKTLENLDVCIYDTESAALSSLCDILVSGDFGFLKSISISIAANQQTATDFRILTDIDCRMLDAVKSLTSKANGLKCLQYSAKVYSNNVLDIIANPCVFFCLQQLNLDYAFLDFEQLARLLRWLPQLLYFQCSLIDEPLALDEHGLSYTVDFIAKFMFPLNEYLRKVDLFARVDIVTENMILAFGLLVAGCPRLNDIEPTRLSKLSEIITGILDTLDIKEFSKYKDRFKWIAEKNKVNIFF